MNNGLVPGSSTGRGATRREFLRLAGGVAACAAGPGAWAQDAGAADHVIEIAPYRVAVSAKQSFETVAYNGQVPGPLLRMREGRPVTIEVRNRTNSPEVVHWHGLFLPPEVDGAMEEGTPMIAAGRGGSVYVFAGAGGVSVVPYAYVCGQGPEEGAVQRTAWVVDDRAGSDRGSCRCGV